MEDSLERQCLERALPLTLGKYDETPGETTGILAENHGGSMGTCWFHRETYRPMVIRKLQHLHFLRFCSHKTWISHVKGHAKVARRPPSNVSTVCDHKQNAYQHGTGTCIQQNSDRTFWCPISQLGIYNMLGLSKFWGGHCYKYI